MPRNSRKMRFFVRVAVLAASLVASMVLGEGSKLSLRSELASTLVSRNSTSTELEGPDASALLELATEGTQLYVGPVIDGQQSQLVTALNSYVISFRFRFDGPGDGNIMLVGTDYMRRWPSIWIAERNKVHVGITKGAGDWDNWGCVDDTTLVVGKEYDLGLTVVRDGSGLTSVALRLDTTSSSKCTGQFTSTTTPPKGQLPLWTCFTTAAKVTLITPVSMKPVSGQGATPAAKPMAKVTLIKKPVSMEPVSGQGANPTAKPKASLTSPVAGATPTASLTSPVTGAKSCQSLSVATVAIEAMGRNAEEADKCVQSQIPALDRVKGTRDMFVAANATAAKVNETVYKLIDKINDMKPKIKKIEPLAKKIPQFGKFVSAGIKVMDQATKFLDLAKSTTNGLAKVLKYSSKAFNVTANGFAAEVDTVNRTARMLRKGSSMGGLAITCAATTSSTCVDDDVVIGFSTTFDKAAQLGYHGIAMCNTAIGSRGTSTNSLDGPVREIFDFIKKLAGVLDPINGLLGKLWDAVAPLINEVSKVVEAIADAMSEWLCCTAPYLVQKGSELVSKVIDVATCPVDGGLLAGVNGILKLAKDEVEGAINKLINSLLQPLQGLFDKLEAIKIEYPALAGEFAFDRSTCEVTTPSLTQKTFTPFGGALAKLMLPTTFDSGPAFDLLSSIKDACNEAIDNLANISPGSCCREFREAKKDGEPCGNLPTSSGGYTCQMCASGTYSMLPQGILEYACGKNPWPDGTLCVKGISCDLCENPSTWWWGKVGTRCGTEPRDWPDGTACLVGTTCNACMNTETWWKSFPPMTRCGSEPCYARGEFCGLVCSKCCSQSSSWAKCT